MFNGWLSFGGRELINAERTRRYVDNFAINLGLQDCEDCPDIQLALEDDIYESPALDDAPWYDPNVPESADFYGVWPLDIEGMEDSTREVGFTEGITDGGSPGGERLASRPIRATGVLIGANQRAIVYGMKWLRNAMSPPPCMDHGGSCNGSKLCYYAACPEVTECYEPTYQLGFSGPIIRIRPESSPETTQNAAYDGIWKAQIDIAYNEGLVLEWGAVSKADDTVMVEEHGPVILARRNYIETPSFRGASINSTWWAISTGTRTYPNLGTDDGYMSRVGGTTGSPIALTSPTITAFNGESILGVDLKSPDATPSPVIIRIRAAVTNELLAEGSFIVDDEWTRYYLPTLYAGSCYVEFWTGGEVHIRDINLEAGQLALPFLDGSRTAMQANAGFVTSEDEYEIAWVDVPYKSASTSTYVGNLWIGAEDAAEDFNDARGGVCDAWPWINVLQGEANGMLHVALRPPISAEAQTRPLERTLHRVAGTQGPTKMWERTTSAGTVLRAVEFYFRAGRPTPYGPTDTLLYDQRMSVLPTAPWIDPDVIEETAVVIIDPDCPPVPSPPRPPTIANACVTPETAWYRYWLTVPDRYVDSWSATSPQVVIRSGAEEIRQVRVRAYPNPFGRELPVEPAFRASRVENGGLKLDATDWVNLGGIGTATGRIVGGSPWCGINFYRATATGAHAYDTFGVSVDAVGRNHVSPGELVRPSIWARSSVARSIRLRYAFRDEAGTAIGGVQFGPNVAVAANTWTRLTVAGTSPLVAPALTERMAIGVSGADTGSWATGNLLDAAGPMVEVSNAWGTFPIDTWWDADQLDVACQPLPPDTFYYAHTGDTALGETSAAAVTSPVDPHSYCSEFVVSYLPAQTELTVDAILEQAFASVAGAPAAPANHLLYAGDGSPIVWPELSCGQEYFITVDVPEPLLDDVYVSVTATKKE